MTPAGGLEGAGEECHTLGRRHRRNGGRNGCLPRRRPQEPVLSCKFQSGSTPLALERGARWRESWKTLRGRVFREGGQAHALVEAKVVHAPDPPHRCGYLQRLSLVMRRALGGAPQGKRYEKCGIPPLDPPAAFSCCLCVPPSLASSPLLIVKLANLLASRISYGGALLSVFLLDPQIMQA